MTNEQVKKKKKNLEADLLQVNLDESLSPGDSYNLSCRDAGGSDFRRNKIKRFSDIRNPKMKFLLNSEIKDTKDSATAYPHNLVNNQSDYNSHTTYKVSSESSTPLVHKASHGEAELMSQKNREKRNGTNYGTESCSKLRIESNQNSCTIQSRRDNPKQKVRTAFGHAESNAEAFEVENQKTEFKYVEEVHNGLGKIGKATNLDGEQPPIEVLDYHEIQQRGDGFVEFGLEKINKCEEVFFSPARYSIHVDPEVKNRMPCNDNALNQRVTVIDKQALFLVIFVVDKISVVESSLSGIPFEFHLNWITDTEIVTSPKYFFDGNVSRSSTKCDSSNEDLNSSLSALDWCTYLETSFDLCSPINSSTACTTSRKSLAQSTYASSGILHLNLTYEHGNETLAVASLDLNYLGTSDVFRRVNVELLTTAGVFATVTVYVACQERWGKLSRVDCLPGGLQGLSGPRFINVNQDDQANFLHKFVSQQVLQTHISNSNNFSGSVDEGDTNLTCESEAHCSKRSWNKGDKADVLNPDSHREALTGTFSGSPENMSSSKDSCDSFSKNEPGFSAHLMNEIESKQNKMKKLDMDNTAQITDSSNFPRVDSWVSSHLEQKQENGYNRNEVLARNSSGDVEKEQVQLDRPQHEAVGTVPSLNDRRENDLFHECPISKDKENSAQRDPEESYLPLNCPLEKTITRSKTGLRELFHVCQKLTAIPSRFVSRYLNEEIASKDCSPQILLQKSLHLCIGLCQQVTTSGNTHEASEAKEYLKTLQNLVDRLTLSIEQSKHSPRTQTSEPLFSGTEVPTEDSQDVSAEKLNDPVCNKTFHGNYGPSVGRKEKMERIRLSNLLNSDEKTHGLNRASVKLGFSSNAVVWRRSLLEHKYGTSCTSQTHEPVRGGSHDVKLRLLATEKMDCQNMNGQEKNITLDNPFSSAIQSTDNFENQVQDPGRLSRYVKLDSKPDSKPDRKWLMSYNCSQGVELSRMSGETVQDSTQSQNKIGLSCRDKPSNVFGSQLHLAEEHEADEESFYAVSKNLQGHSGTNATRSYGTGHHFHSVENKAFLHEASIPRNAEIYLERHFDRAEDLNGLSGHFQDNSTRKSLLKESCKFPIKHSGTQYFDKRLNKVQASPTCRDASLLYESRLSVLQPNFKYASGHDSSFFINRDDALAHKVESYEKSYQRNRKEHEEEHNTLSESVLLECTKRLELGMQRLEDSCVKKNNTDIIHNGESCEWRRVGEPEVRSVLHSPQERVLNEEQKTHLGCREGNPSSVCESMRSDSERSQEGRKCVHSLSSQGSYVQNNEASVDQNVFFPNKVVEHHGTHVTGDHQKVAQTKQSQNNMSNFIERKIRHNDSCGHVDVHQKLSGSSEISTTNFSTGQSESNNSSAFIKRNQFHVTNTPERSLEESCGRIRYPTEAVEKIPSSLEFQDKGLPFVSNQRSTWKIAPHPLLTRTSSVESGKSVTSALREPSYPSYPRCPPSPMKKFSKEFVPSFNLPRPHIHEDSLGEVPTVKRCVESKLRMSISLESRISPLENTYSSCLAPPLPARPLPHRRHMSSSAFFSRPNSCDPPALG